MHVTTTHLDDPGTPAFLRVMLLGLSQTELGARAEPPLPQADVHLFERAKVRLTRKKAQRLAPALFPAIHACAGGALSAELAVWSIWFRAVDLHGEAALKRYAQQMRTVLAALGWSLPLWQSVQKEMVAAVALEALKPAEGAVLPEAEGAA